MKVSDAFVLNSSKHFLHLKPKPDRENNLQYLLYIWIQKTNLRLTINFTSNTFDPISSTMTMASFFSSSPSLLMFKEMLFPSDSSFKLENLLRFLLFLILTPVAIFSTLALMVVFGTGVALLQLLVVLMENTLANNLVMAVDFINNSLLECRKLIFTTFTFTKERDSKDSGKANSWVSSDSGIDSPNLSEADNDEFAEPHDAWVEELGTGAYEADFQERSESLYLVFWYYVCNNFLM